MLRSKAALLFSVRTFFELSERPYFWTFTFKECLAVDDALARWEKFRKALWNWGIHPKTGEQTIVGLRCFELHPGGHGVHVHALFNRFIHVRTIRRIGAQHGFGRDHVIRVRSLDQCECLADYMAKYCSKQDRPPCFRGRRLWAAIGKWGATRCKDIEVQSEFVEAFKARRRVINAEAAIAKMEGRKYRVEHNLETMAWAKHHCFQVKTGKKAPLTSYIVDISEKETPPPDGADWEGLWSDVDVESLRPEMVTY
jgi:hypothetical protein